MSLSYIDAKLAYIRNALSAKDIADLSAVHANEYLLLDLLYCLVKHSNWLRVPVFKHLLCASLVHKHGLEFDACQRLLTETTDAFIKIKNINPVECSDSDFIRYMFILTLSTADDEQRLILELGFGRLFLQKLKEFLRQVAKGDKAQSFLFGFEALCYETLVSLASDLVGNHAKLARYRLQYQLAQASSGTEQEVNIDESALLELLCRMQDKPLTVRDIDSAALPMAATSLVAMLERSGLIYHGDFLARKRLYVWRVTALGAEIASLAKAASLDSQALPTGAG